MQIYAFIFGLVALLTPTILADSAPVTNDNPEGAQYVAALPSGGAVSGSVVASSTYNGTGVRFQVSISGLPKDGGPFRK